MASLMAHGLVLRPSALFHPQFPSPRVLSIRQNFTPNIPFPAKIPYLSLSVKNPRTVVSALPKVASRSPKTPTGFPLADSTRSITTLVLLAYGVAKIMAQKLCLAILNPSPQIQESFRASLGTVGPAFFAALRDRPSGSLNTPLTVVAAGLSKWLDIYSGVLMVRVLLSWFPNIPWDRQPLSAIRDLCDPYLNLFRNIIPPVFDTLDVSPLLAFAVLGTLGSILNNSRG